MAKPAPTAPRPAKLEEGTPGRVRAILADARSKKGAPATAHNVRAPKIPGDKKKPGRPKLAPGELSQSPSAVRARKARAEKAQRMTRTLAPPPSREGEGATMTPDALRARTTSPAAPALTGDISPRVPRVLTPDIRNAAVKSFSGFVKVAGILAAAFWGDEMKVPDDDALGTAELCIDAWPELADQLGDTAKLLALGAVGGLVAERVNIVKGRRTLPRRAAPPPNVDQRPAPAGMMQPQTMPT